MHCERCQEKDATVHLTQVIDGEVKKTHLCEACAEAGGIDLQSPASIADALLLGLGQGDAAPAGDDTPADAPDHACPRCHLTPSDFKRTGRLGCPTCYEAWRERLRPLVRSMQRGERHEGKTPQRLRQDVRHAIERERLGRELEEAVAKEAYEDAATLRDRIRRLRDASGSTEEPSA